jgi:hypothetical protein
MFTLRDVVPWGRSLDEYRRMFALSDDDLSKRILGAADGPASFNAELTERGGRVVSFDPLYGFTTAEINRRFEEVYEIVIDQTRRNADEFVWCEAIPDIETLGQMRRAAVRRFLADYDAGTALGRYVAAALPTLPFASNAFDLALCSHFLFLYSEHLSEGFHVESIRELCRVCREVRVFPLVELGGKPSRHISPVASRLRDEGCAVSIERVNYEFQRGANQVMRIACG